MTTRPLRVAAFGVGRMGQVHVEHLIRLSARGDIDFAAIGDRHAPTLLSAVALVAELGTSELASHLQRFSAPEEMAARARLDGVVIASRTEDHTRDSLAFIRHGTAVMLEKPMANSVGDAVEFSRAIGDKGRRLIQLGFQRHYDAAAESAQKWVADGLIGTLQQTHHIIQDKNPTPEGYQSPGITADMAIHLVFEAMSFRGFELPRHVQALQFMAPHYEDRAREGANIVHAFCSWANGSLAHLWGSRINNTGYDNGFTLVGTEGRIDVGEFVGDFGAVTAKLWQGVGSAGPRGRLTESLEFAMTPPRDTHPDFYARFAAAYARELSAFLDSVRNGSILDPGPDVGWKTLLVANLAEKSSRLGGHRFDLLLPSGKPITTLDQAAEFATAVGLE